MSIRGGLALASVGVGALVVWSLCGTRPGADPCAAPSRSAEADEGDGSSGSSLPPLEIDPDAPLLLEEPEPGGQEPPARPAADNQACYVCHANYDGEPLVQWHAEANVGCVECHGPSHPHRNDEDNITPPDVMYPRDRVDRCCAECHDDHDVPARDVIARWQERCPERTDPGGIVCTDCHGDHRLSRRTVRWDKRTGKLLIGQPGASEPPSTGQ